MKVVCKIIGGHSGRRTPALSSCSCANTHARKAVRSVLVGGQLSVVGCTRACYTLFVATALSQVPPRYSYAA